MRHLSNRLPIRELTDSSQIASPIVSDDKDLSAPRDWAGTNPSPKEQNANSAVQKILVGDCLETLKTMPDNTVNLVVTSPPYNVGKNYEVWNDQLPYEEYIDFTREWIEQCYRVLMDGEILCVNLPVSDIGGRLPFLDIYQILRQVGFWHQDFIAWVKWNGKKIDTSGFAVSKRKAFGKKRKRRLVDAFEVILVVRKPPENWDKAKYLNVDPVSVAEMNFNIWHIPPVWDKKHPAPFPQELPNRLITLYSKEGDTVLDPFLGTGTTLQAAHGLKRGGIGCELNPNYVELILKKLEFPIQVYRLSESKS